MEKYWITPAGDRYGLYADMLEQPHLMVAGATGSGKSVLVNALIYTALYKFPLCDDNSNSAGLILVDNGKGTEMIDYNDLPHTLRYAFTTEESISALEYGLSIAKERFANMRARRIKTYDGGDVYICIDEFASLILNGKKRVSALVQDIAQIGRSAKVHVILCTQCPLATVIPTAIKVNFDARVALRTRSAQDSRNILGTAGCEQLPRHGQGYYMRPEGMTLYNLPMIPQDELDARVKWWMDQKEKNEPERPQMFGGFFRKLFGSA